MYNEIAGPRRRQLESEESVLCLNLKVLLMRATLWEKGRKSGTEKYDNKITYTEDKRAMVSSVLCLEVRKYCRIHVV